MSIASDGLHAPMQRGEAADAEFRALEQAAQWFATLQDESVTEQEQGAWQTWLHEQPCNRQAWQHITAVSKRFDPLRAQGSQDAAVAGLKAARTTPVSRRGLLRDGSVAVGIGILAWLGWRHTGLADAATSLAADFRTVPGEIRELTLADGTRVWLNTASALDIDFDNSLRRLHLLYGEILIETALDLRQSPQRPFVVDTRFGRLQALGTRFTVRMLGQQDYLAVYQGAVRIRTSDGALRVIQAGQQVRYDAGNIGQPESVDRSREAWSRGVLAADNLRLDEMLAELSRYQGGYISIAPAVAGLRVMGVYPARDPDTALMMLEQSLPIRVHRTLPWWTSVGPR